MSPYPIRNLQSVSSAETIPDNQHNNKKKEKTLSASQSTDEMGPT